jgi:hypothetical protein
MTPLPPDDTPWPTSWHHAFTCGSIIFQTAMPANVLAIPAQKLLRWTCRLGRYTKPPPAE